MVINFRNLDASNAETDITEIFEELRDQDVNVEGRGRSIVYKGDALDFKITEDRAEYTQKTGINSAEDLAAIAYLQTSLKKHGYREIHAELKDADLGYTPEEA